MTQPNEEWIQEMSRLLKEHARAQTMRDAWERKRLEAATAIEVYRTGNSHNLEPQLTEPEPVAAVE